VRVSVFMSVFNCHVNRAPIAGKVTAVVYRPGKFLNASLDKASEENERNALAIEMADGRKIAVVQIAGLVAPAYPVLDKAGGQPFHRRALRPDPLWQPAGRLPARWGGAAGRGRQTMPWRARR
jgi:hypothetical protein